MLLAFVLTFLALMIFRMLPGFDIYVSQLAFAEQACTPQSTAKVCGRFFVQEIPSLRTLRNISLDVGFWLALGTLFYLLYHLVFSRRTTAEDLRKISLVIWTLALSTGFLVNMVLKQYWGRPRPFRVEELGGENTFVLPGTISDQCASNCSFVSGEASGAAWIFTFLLFVPRGWRWPAGLAIGIYTAFFSGLRIAFGRHFLSDVVISVLITLCVFMTLRAIFSTSRFQQWFENTAQWSNQLAFDWRRK